MKRIDLNSKNFNFLLERMDKKNTLFEVEKKFVLLEGIIDDIIKAAKRVPTNIGFSSPSLRIIETSLDEFIVNVDRILLSLKTGKTNLESLKNNLKIEDIVASTKKWNLYITRIIDQINLGNTPQAIIVKKDVFNYISGKSELLSNDSLRFLNQNQISSFEDLKNITNEFNDFIVHVEKINKITKNILPNSKLDDVVGELLSESGIVSLSDVKRIFDDLESYNLKYPDDELSDIYEIFKTKFNLVGKNSDEIITIFKKSLRDNEIYKTLDIGFRKKIVSWFRKKLFKRIDDINFELSKKIDWENSIIYFNKNEDRFYVITTKNKEELDQVFNQISEQGFKPRKTDGSNGSKGFGAEDLTERQKGEEYAKGGRDYNLKFYSKIIGGGIVLVGVPTVLYCYYKYNKLRDEKKIDASTIGDDVTTEKDFFGVIGSCFVGASKEVLEISISAGKSIFKNDILPELAVIEGSVNIWLDEKCGRKDSKRVNGKPITHCENCLDCDKDLDKESIKKIKIKNGDGKEVELGKVFGNIELFLKPEFLMPKHPESYKDLIKQIKEDGNNGIINSFLTEKGTAVPLDDMIVILCNQHSKQCVAEHFNKIMGEIIIDSKNQDCESFDSFMDDKINTLKGYNKRGLLFWGPSEKSVDISVNSNGENLSTIKTDDGNLPFGGVNSVDQFLQRLEDFKINTKKFVCEESDTTTDELEMDLIDTKKPIDIMKELWINGDVKLECAQWKNDLVSSKKNKMKISMASLFSDYFQPLIPNIDWYGEEWDEAFNYWWDKQRFYCKISN
jgi:hypothetical protein